jgi:hypothetical protein
VSTVCTCRRRKKTVGLDEKNHPDQVCSYSRPFILNCYESMVSRRLKCTGKQILHKQLQLEKLLKRQYNKISLGHIFKSDIFLKKEQLGLLLYDTLFSIEADILKLSNKRTSCPIDISNDCYISIVVRTKQQILPGNILW